jgi:hypothetical protein
MAQTIIEMDSLTTEAEKTIDKYERSTSASGVLEVEVASSEREQDDA